MAQPVGRLIAEQLEVAGVGLQLRAEGADMAGVAGLAGLLGETGQGRGRVRRQQAGQQQSDQAKSRGRCAASAGRPAGDRL